MHLLVFYARKQMVEYDYIQEWLSATVFFSGSFSDSFFLFCSHTSTGTIMTHYMIHYWVWCVHNRKLLFKTKRCQTPILVTEFTFYRTKSTKLLKHHWPRKTTLREEVLLVLYKLAIYNIIVYDIKQNNTPSKHNPKIAEKRQNRFPQHIIHDHSLHALYGHFNKKWRG